jgi:hypothetical protein
MILLNLPGRFKRIPDDQELLQMQNMTYDILHQSTLRLAPELERLLLVKSLTIILSVPVDSLQTETLKELIWQLPDGCDNCRDLLDVQNVLMFTLLQLLVLEEQYAPSRC